LSGNRYRLGAVVGIELAEDGSGVELYRPFADPEGAGDLLGGEAARDEAKNLALPVGKPGAGRRSQRRR